MEAPQAFSHRGVAMARQASSANGIFAPSLPFAPLREPEPVPQCQPARRARVSRKGAKTRKARSGCAGISASARPGAVASCLRVKLRGLERGGSFVHCHRNFCHRNLSDISDRETIVNDYPFQSAVSIGHTLKCYIYGRASFLSILR